jgi:CheY-like chemotaxis protein
MSKIKSVILIDNCEIDNFINHKLLEYYGVSDIRIFKKVNEALTFLNETAINYQFIFVGIYMPMMTGFEFIDKFRALELHNKHGNIILLSAFFSPDDIEIANDKGIKRIDKPLTINQILKYV